MKSSAGLQMESLTDWIRTGSFHLVSTMVEEAFRHKRLRQMLFQRLEQHVIARAHGMTYPGCPQRVLEDQADMIRAIFASVGRALDRGQISHQVLHRLIQSFLANVVLGRECDRAVDQAVAQFAERHEGEKPPSFLVISPTSACNLRCPGCYADSGYEARHLEWDILDRIITEAKKLWGIRFFTISGGEPLIYRSQGRQLLDLAERHSDSFFQVYTNGYFIERALAQRMAEAGNVLPAISVEGLEARTDQRRGPGAFKKILEAMANLRNCGVPFGISITATRENVEEILSDEFLDFFFEKQQAIFGWLFQYMPIGRGYTVDLVVTPEQRLKMWERTWQIIRQRKIMLADFWNCGTVTEGCIAAGHSYFYIDWNGKIMPCVFVPYAAANIHEIYSNGGTLDDIYDLAYFRAIRSWQLDYSFGKGQGGKCGNYIIPCSLRDHYALGRDLIDRYGAEPENLAAAEALRDPDYACRMLAYDEELARVFDPVWKRVYLDAESRSFSGSADLCKTSIAAVVKANHERPDGRISR